jgi:hypothetical protein
VDDFFDGDLHAGISNIVLEPEAFDLGEGVTIRKTYAHLMAHFLMAFASPPPSSFHPGPWKATKGTASFAADITADLCRIASISTWLIGCAAFRALISIATSKENPLGN